MKKNIEKRRFTLIELLVVIAVIAILVGMLMPAVKTVWGRAKTTRARSDVHSLMVAIKQYESEFQYLPFTGAGGSDKTETSSGTFVDILTGSGNSRGIQFLEPRSDGTFEDPWNQAYNIALDLDYDNEIDATHIPGVSSPLKASVAVWSEGPESGTSDDICSWHD
mgnify:CR=1 FL=1